MLFFSIAQHIGVTCMQTSRLRTWFIIQLYAYYTYYLIYRINFKAFFGTITRTWCTEELRRWSRRIIKLIRIDYRIINPYQIEPHPNKPTIIMSNHTGFLNGPLSLNVFHHHPVRVLSTKIMYKVPLLGHAMRASEFAFVNKSNRQEAIRDLEHMVALMKTGIVMWYAPEGLTSFSDQLLPFKKGGFIAAIHAGAMIIPMSIQGGYHIYKETFPLNRRKRIIDILSGGLTCTPFYLKQRVNVYIGQPIDASQYTLATKEMLMERVFQAIQERLSETSNSCSKPNSDGTKSGFT